VLRSITIKPGTGDTAATNLRWHELDEEDSLCSATDLREPLASRRSIQRALVSTGSGTMYITAVIEGRVPFLERCF